MLAARRLNTDDFDIGILLLEKTANTADCAARADTGEEKVDFAVCLFPDLGPGRAVVCFHVERTLILVRADVLAAVGLALHHAFDDAACAFGWKQGAELIFHFDQFGAKKTQQ